MRMAPNGKSLAERLEGKVPDEGWTGRIVLPPELTPVERYRSALGEMPTLAERFRMLSYWLEHELIGEVEAMEIIYPPAPKPAPWYVRLWRWVRGRHG